MSRTSHEITYRIQGDDLQWLEIDLDPGETVIGEAGAMLYLEDGIAFETKMGDGSNPDEGTWGKLKAAGKRAISQESIFLTHFTNQGQVPRVAAYASEFPGKIIPIDLQQQGGRVIAQKDAFLAAALGAKIGIAFQKKIGAGLFGGEGFILQDIQGDGMVFLSAGGGIISKQLNGETLRVDTGCIVAMSPGITYDIQRAGNLKSMVFGGEGLFLATLSGHGWVLLQSLPFSRLADKIIASAPSAGGRSSEEGSVIGGLGSMFERR